MNDMDYWDGRAENLAGARQAVWDESPSTWQSGIAAALAELEPALADVLTPGAVILDLGCGCGRLTLPLQRTHPEAMVVGVDYSVAMIRWANFERGDSPKPVYYHNDGRTLPAQVGELDGAFSVLLFQHLRATAMADYIAEVGRSMRQGGIFRFQWCATKDDAGLSQGHTEPEVLAWCDTAGFEVTELDTSKVYPVWRWATAVRV